MCRWLWTIPFRSSSQTRKKLRDAEKRISELDRLFTRLYEDNVSGKISDERFSMMFAGYEDEQKKLRATVSELTTYIETAEQKSADVTAFIKAVQKYEHITELTPEIMHELRGSCSRQEQRASHAGNRNTLPL